MHNCHRKMRGVLWTCGILAGMLPGLVTWAGAADIVINETLSPGDYYFIGEDVSAAASPYTNSDNYSLMVSADDTGTSDDVHFTALGLYAGTSVEIDNLGTILLNATGGTAANGAGSAVATVETYGIFSPATVSNGGNVTLHASAGSATATTTGNASVKAYGLLSYTAVTNSATTTVTGAAGTTSAGADATAAAGTASGGTTANTDADGYGIDADGAVINSGNIAVSATGGSATGDTAAGADSVGFGINSDDSIVNSGMVTVTSAGGIATSNNDESAFATGTAFGIFADGDLTNSGAISVTATGGTANAGASEPHALALGLHSGGDIHNTGDITATAIYGNGSGSEPLSGGFEDAHALAGGIVSSGGAVFNSGDIRVTATAGETYNGVAVGIFMDNSGTLTNTGVIQALGDTRSYEVAVTFGTLTLADTYNLNLDADPSVGSLYLAGGTTLDLNGATLSVTAVGDTARLNTEYMIFDTSDGGTVSGAFGALATPINPAVVALYHDQATVTSADDTISLGFRPTASPQLEGLDLLRHAVTLSADLVGQRLVTYFLRSRLPDRTSRRYAAAFTTADDAGHRYGAMPPAHFFFTPYYANVDKDASPVGYDADLVGFVTGLERQAGNNRFDFHLGYGHAGLDFTGDGYRGDQEDQELLSAGVALMGNRGHWTWRGQFSGFYGWHDYEGLTGVGLEQHEKANYNSYGVHTAVLGGYTLSIGRQVLLPEAGIEYLWLHRDSFTTDATYAGWNVHNSSLDEHQVSALASLRWLTRIHFDEFEMTPSLAAGVRCLLTDDRLDAHQSVAGSAPVTVRTEQDEVAGTVAASLRLRKHALATELAYNGEFGDATTLHSAWLRFSYLF